jgi:hypothetical protein
MTTILLLKLAIGLLLWLVLSVPLALIIGRLMRRLDSGQ